MTRDIRTAIRMTAALVIITGLLYPLVVTSAAQVLFKDRAGGSLIERDGAVVGSTYIGQVFTQDQYFSGRISAAGVTEDNPNGYDALVSGASNLGPTNQVLIDRVQASIEAIAAREGVEPSRIPADAVYASGSGLDPDISPEYAEIQVARVARVRGISEELVRALVREHTSGRQFGVLGEPRVNVLKLNLALDGR
ncbi:MAG: potassium-transporting ATPase subunit KdpC [Dehalococcoidia bacterium]